jgi:hypothetical protein
MSECNMMTPRFLYCALKEQRWKSKRTHLLILRIDKQTRPGCPCVDFLPSGKQTSFYQSDDDHQQNELNMIYGVPRDSETDF